MPGATPVPSLSTRLSQSIVPRVSETAPVSSPTTTPPTRGTSPRRGLEERRRLHRRRLFVGFAPRRPPVRRLFQPIACARNAPIASLCRAEELEQPRACTASTSSASDRHAATSRGRQGLRPPTPRRPVHLPAPGTRPRATRPAFDDSYVRILLPPPRTSTPAARALQSMPYDYDLDQPATTAVATCSTSSRSTWRAQHLRDALSAKAERIVFQLQRRFPRPGGRRQRRRQGQDIDNDGADQPDRQRPGTLSDCWSCRRGRAESRGQPVPEQPGLREGLHA